MKIVNKRGQNHGPSQGGPEPTPINLDPNDLEDIICEQCENPTFQPASMFKRLPASLSPSGQATLVPLQIYECSSCKWVNDEFLPKLPPKADE